MVNHAPQHTPNKSPKDAKIDRTFHALSTPARRWIVERLSHAGAIPSELAQPLGISLPAVVQHLDVLEAAGLIRTQKQGRTRQCTLRREALNEIDRWLATRRRHLEQKLDRLARALGE